MGVRTLELGASDRAACIKLRITNFGCPSLWLKWTSFWHTMYAAESYGMKIKVILLSIIGINSHCLNNKKMEIISLSGQKLKQQASYKSSANNWQINNRIREQVEYYLLCEKWWAAWLNARCKTVLCTEKEMFSRKNLGDFLTEQPIRWPLVWFERRTSNMLKNDLC